MALTAEIVDGTGTVVSKHFEFVTLTSTGEAMTTGPAPYLDLHPLPEQARPAAQSALTSAWLTTGVEQLATSWAVTHAQPQHLQQVRDQLLPLIEKTKSAVRQRLVQQINYPRRRSRPDPRRPERRQGWAVPARTGKAPTGWKPAPANSKPASNDAPPNSTPKRNSPQDHQPWSAPHSSSPPASSPDPSPPTPRRRPELNAARSTPPWPPNAHWAESQ